MKSTSNKGMPICLQTLWASRKSASAEQVWFPCSSASSQFLMNIPKSSCLQPRHEVSPCFNTALTSRLWTVYKNWEALQQRGWATFLAPCEAYCESKRLAVKFWDLGYDIDVRRRIHSQQDWKKSSKYVNVLSFRHQDLHGLVNIYYSYDLLWICLFVYTFLSLRRRTLVSWVSARRQQSQLLLRLPQQSSFSFEKPLNLTMQRWNACFWRHEKLEILLW